MTSTDKTFESVSWLDQLEEEARLLLRLAELAPRARDASLRDTETSFQAIIRDQVEVCERLEALRGQRRALLTSRRVPPEDFVRVVIEEMGPDSRDEVETTLATWTDAATAAQEEIELSRRFFEVARESIEEVVETLTDSRPAEYGAEGRVLSPNPRSLTATTL